MTATFERESSGWSWRRAFARFTSKSCCSDAAPPARPDDYFYRVAKERSVRSAESRNYFDELITCPGGSQNGEMEEESGLDTFQRRGLYLAYAVECPVQDAAELENAVKRAAPTLLKRLQISYRPKFVAILSRPLNQLISVLQDAGWGDRLILDDGRPFASPFQSVFSANAGRVAQGLRSALKSGT